MNAVEILKSHGIKKTSPRVAIIEALLSRNNPLSENEVKCKMGDLYDRITFYRSVQTLIDAGIMHKITVDNAPAKYALNHCTHVHQHQVEHVHFVCRSCQSTECLTEVRTQLYTLPAGYVNESCDVVIKGLCINCSSL